MNATVAVYKRGDTYVGAIWIHERPSGFSVDRDPELMRRGALALADECGAITATFKWCGSFERPVTLSYIKEVADKAGEWDAA